MINILEDIKKYRSLSIIGNYKNVGKTTTLNYIIDKAKGDITLGLTSIGVDGEDEDIVTKTDKPKIYVYKGSLIATAKSCVLSSDITKEILEVTNITTSIGNVVIFKALSDGFVEIAGPSINSQIKYICSRLNEYGAELSIVDGALSRKTMASPSITESTILCTGAVVSNNMNKVIEQTVYEASMLKIDKVNDDKFDSMYTELRDYKVSLVNKDYSYKVLDIKTALDCHKEIVDNIDDDTKYVVVNGILTDSFIENLIKSGVRYKDIVICIPDGTKMFLGNNVYEKFVKMGVCIKVIDEINLIGISVNPTSINGYSFDCEKFISGIQSRVEVPVFDVKM